MMRRWVIRSVLMLPILLCMAETDEPLRPSAHYTH